MSDITKDIWEDNMERIFEQISELDADWRDQPRDAVGPREISRVFLKVTNDTNVGLPEYVITDDENCNVDIKQLKLLTLQVQVESTNMDASHRARASMERIRLRLYRPSTLAAFRVIESSLIDVAPTIVVDTTQDNRALSVATADLRMHRIDQEPDVAFGRIDKIAIAGKVLNALGATVATSSLVIDLPDP